MSIRGKPPHSTAGFTLVELLVTLAILAILVGLLLPAVQATRGAARWTDCKNRIRQIALATSMYESAFREFPMPYFDGDLDDPAKYTSDHGLFTSLLPYLGYENAYTSLDLSTTAFAKSNQPIVQTVFPALTCPSAPEPTIFDGAAPRFAAAGLQDHHGATGDYIGNEGSLDGSVIRSGAIGRMLGPFGVRIKGVSDKTSRVGQIVDGTSNTFGFWESVGSQWLFRENGVLVQSSIDAYPVEKIVLVDFEVGTGYFYKTLGTVKSYVFSWAGVGISTIKAFDRNGQVILSPIGARTINVSNTLRTPFSMHPTGVTVAMMDGSVHVINDSIDGRVAFALATRAGQEMTTQLRY